MPSPVDLNSSFAALMSDLADPRPPARMKALKAAIAKTESGSLFKRFLLSRLDVLSEGGAAMLLQTAMATAELRPVCLAWLGRGEKTPPWLQDACPPQNGASPILWRTPSPWQPKMRLRLTGRGLVLAAHGKQVLELGLEDGELWHRWRLSAPVTQFVASPDGEALVVATGKTIHRLPWRGKAKDTITVTRPEDYSFPVTYLGFDKSGDHVICGHQYSCVAIHRATDLEVVASACVQAQFDVAHPFGGNVLADGIGEHRFGLVIVDVAGGKIQAAFGKGLRGWAVVQGGRIESCEDVSGQYVLRLRQLETTEVLDEIDLGRPVESGQVIYKTLSLTGASPCGRYAAVQVYSSRNSEECETLLVDWHTRSIHPLGPRTYARWGSVFTPEHFYVRHRRGLARFNLAGQLTALLPFPGSMIDLVVEGDRAVSLVDRGGVIGSYEIVGLDLTPASSAIPSAPASEPLRSLATFPDGSLRGLKGSARLVTLDPTSGETSAEIPLGQAYSNVLVPLRDGQVLVDEPARLIHLSDLSVQAIDGGEGSQYESVSVDRAERFALATFDESSQTDLIDLSQHRVTAHFGTSEKNARITAAVLSPDGTFALLGSDQGRITEVSMDAAAPQRTLANIPGAIAALVCVRAGCVAVTEKWLALVPREGEPWKVAHHAGASARLVVSADEVYLALAGDAGRLEIWSLPELVCTAWTDLGTAATSLTFHGTRIVAADSAGGFHCFELKGS